MPRLRRLAERTLRATGTFQLTKRAFQRVETAGLQFLKHWEKMLHGAQSPTRRESVVMLHTGRSGSSVLGDMLGRHPAIHWDGELFNYQLQLWRRRPKFRLPEAICLIERRMNLFDKPCYGFEILKTHLQAGQMTNSEFITALESLGIEQFILLTRKNILRKIISNLVARQRGRWRVEAGEVLPITRIHVDVDKLRMASVKPLLDHISDMQKEYADLRSVLSSRRHLQLVYEDDVQRDPRRAYRKICEFLEVDYAELPVRHGRTTPQPLRQVIRNYDEVARLLSATEFGWMLGESSGPELSARDRPAQQPGP